MNGRNSRKPGTGRDSGGFAAIPWSVLDCAAYASLSCPAKAMLVEFARQFKGGNNGSLVATMNRLSSRGWHSAGRIHAAKHELIAAGFIFETVKGQRPNKAARYALTWQSLDRLPGYDVGAVEAFPRGAYRFAPSKPKRQAPTCKNPKKNEGPIPAHGTTASRIVPVVGIEADPLVPVAGTIWPVFH